MAYFSTCLEKGVFSEARMRGSAQGPSARCERGAMTTTRRGGSEGCDMGDGGGTAVACDSRNTKFLELRFRAWLTEDGTRHSHLTFGRTLNTQYPNGL
jgi:hypothetical protein